MRDEEIIAMEVNGEPVSLRAVLTCAKWQGQLQFLGTAADSALIRQIAGRRGVTVSDEELQQAADDFRLAHGLEASKATHLWLAARHLTMQDWEALLEQEVVARKLRDLVTESEVEPYFAEHRLSFDSVALSRIVVDDADVARELHAQIQEDNADFHALARRYSQDPDTRPAGGYMGVVRRGALDAPTQAAVFGAQPGQVVGPAPGERVWVLVKIEALQPAVLEGATREAIQGLLFEAWLERQRAEAQIHVPLLDTGLSRENN